MSRRVGKAALLGFAAGALQGVGQFLQTRAAQEAERLREERLAAIRAEERSQDRAFQESRDSSQRAFNLEIMGRQEATQAKRDDKQHSQRLEEIKQQGLNNARYARAITANGSGGNNGGPVVPRFLIQHPDKRQEVIEGTAIPAGATALGNIRADGTFVPIAGRKQSPVAADAVEIETEETTPEETIVYEHDENGNLRLKGQPPATPAPYDGVYDVRKGLIPSGPRGNSLGLNNR
jgi:hypothetical protein